MGGGGSIGAPQNWGGVWEKGSIDRSLISYYELWRRRRRNFFLSIKNGQFFSPNLWPVMDFLNPLDALFRKIPFSFFADFWVWVTSEAWGSVSVGFWGSLQLSPFSGGGSSQGAQSTPPPPQLKARLPKDTLEMVVFLLSWLEEVVYTPPL